MSISKLFTTTWQGGKGIPFDDTPTGGKCSCITKIVIHFSGSIRSLQVTYSGSDGPAINHGSHTKKRVEFTLSGGEYITKVEGAANDSWIIALTFITNKRTHGPFGGSGGKPFIWQGPGGTSLRPDRPMRLLAFSGTVNGEFLSGLRGIFCESSAYMLKTIRYESRAIQTIPPLSIVPSESFSSFTFHIMNPTIPLFIGEDRVLFYVHKDTLCQLPFFKAALSGGFKEASGQVISLPEDNPSHVSALIEFLYTGNYTYTYNPDTVNLSNGSIVPAGDTVECMFHIGVYIVASKYDCQGLAKMATLHFEYVESELDGIEVVRVWKIAYAADMRFSARTNGPRAGGGLALWVKAMFREHREEMEQAFDVFPMLASDLLCKVADRDD